SRMFYLNGKDRFAHRLWSAFDSSPLIYPDADIMFVGGENGVIYYVKLNSQYAMSTPYLSIAPDIAKVKYQESKAQYQGIESSLVGFKDKLYTSDNHGFIQCLSAFDL